MDYDTAVENMLKSIENNPFQVTSLLSMQNFGIEMRYSVIPLSIYLGMNSFYYKERLYSSPFKKVSPFLSSRFFAEYFYDLQDKITDGKEISKIIKSDSRIELSLQYYDKIKKDARKVIENSYAINSWNEFLYQYNKERLKEELSEIDKLVCQYYVTYFEAGLIGAYPLECALFMGKDLYAGYDEEFQTLTLDLPEEEPTLEKGFSKDAIMDYYLVYDYIDVIKTLMKASIPQPDFEY